MSTKSAPRLQVKDGDSSFEDDDNEEATNAANDAEASDLDALTRKIGSGGKQKADVCSLSEAAFYMSEGSDACALKPEELEATAEAGRVDVDDVDGRFGTLQQRALCPLLS